MIALGNLASQVHVWQTIVKPQIGDPRMWLGLLCSFCTVSLAKLLLTIPIVINEKYSNGSHLPPPPLLPLPICGTRGVFCTCLLLFPNNRSLKGCVQPADLEAAVFGASAEAVRTQTRGVGRLILTLGADRGHVVRGQDHQTVVNR